MPTPPRKGEKQKDFVSRCIPEVLNDKTATDTNQASAMCYSMYTEHKKKLKENMSTFEKECAKFNIIQYEPKNK